MRRLLLALAAGCALVAPVTAQGPGALKIDGYTLPNGLKVLLAEDHTVQVVAVDVWYDVGARNERAGRTGFAHLFEHMMFQGSANVKKAEHGQFIERAGGVYNGSTQPDRTNYYQALPSNRINLALWLEADRMRSLAITPENLDNQRKAVQEERRLRVDNQPYSGAFIDSIPQLWDREACFAYSHSIIGSMDDLNAAKVEDVKAFFDLYYAPSNATLVVAGDFDPIATKKMIADYFGAIPAGKPTPKVTCDQKMNTGAMRKPVADAKATLPAVLVAYRVPPVSSPDFPALELLGRILGAGESSRIKKALVRESKVAADAQTLVNPFGPMRGAGLFGALAIANQGASIDSVERQLAAVMTQVGTTGVDAAELAKAKNQFLAAKVNERQTPMALAEAIHYANTYLGSPEAVNTDLARYDAVTLADVQRVAKQYLRADNSLTLLIAPEKK
ncbi:MAG: insulinase family protein [Gemmatimonadaceae bacterium]|nr:insulinase family protein [Gemmatimonadaceae bacterium]